MDQDKAQQSIDTLSEKVNGVVRSVLSQSKSEG